MLSLTSCWCWEPYKVPTHDRKKYFLTLLDDHSRFTWVFLLPSKVEVIVIIRQFFIMVKNVHSCIVKFLRTYNGCAFFNSQMTELLQSLGIVHQSSYISTPQQNGIAERRHRYILNTARALRFQAGVPLRFLGECVSTAAYIINKLTTQVLFWTTVWSSSFLRPHENFWLSKICNWCKKRWKILT